MATTALDPEYLSTFSLRFALIFINEITSCVAFQHAFPSWWERNLGSLVHPIVVTCDDQRPVSSVQRYFTFSQQRNKIERDFEDSLACEQRSVQQKEHVNSCKEQTRVDISHVEEGGFVRERHRTGQLDKEHINVLRPKMK